MSGSSIKGRLVALVLFMAIALIAVGSIGFHTAASAETDLRETYEHQTVPMRELARIRRLIVENAGQVFRALQHNPSIEYAKLHDHPITEHTGTIEKNLAWADETWVSLNKSLEPGSPEAALMKELGPLYQSYVKEVVRPMLGALAGGDYSVATTSTFLKTNRAYEQKLNPLFAKLAETQQNSVKATYESASARNHNLRMISVGAMLAGLALAIVLATLIIRSITGPMNEMREVILRAANHNDFTGQIRTHGKDEIGETATAFNAMMQTLRTSLARVKQSILQVDAATGDLASAADQAAKASELTSESASAMAASVEEMSVSITSVSDSTREALSIAQNAGARSDESGRVITNAIGEMDQIAGLVRDVSDTITELGKNSDQISSVVQVIKDVADQTNLLALNAAIEAARAGEAGRGFAVVADEVRKLAERTSKATGEIAEMISNIQNSSHQAVQGMGSTVNRVETGTREAKEAGEAIVAIHDSANSVVHVVNNINDAMAEQGSASQDIARRVEAVAQASEESNASVQQVAATARTIFDLSADMRRTVDQFKV